jgi:FkbM family methyltransferase
VSKTIARIVAGFASAVSITLPHHRRLAVKTTASEYLAQTVRVTTRRGDLLFYAPTRRSLHTPWLFHTDEPDTLAWVDRFPDDAVLWDIGANVGQFALYAALRPGVRVVAFEPGAASYAVLNRNIELNRMDGRVAAYCIALSDKTGLGAFNMATTEAGSSMHAYDTTVDAREHQIEVIFRQAAVGFSADDFLRQFAPPRPTHVKIDVDSIEARIIRGAHQVLGGPTVQSAWVEVMGSPDTPRNRDIAAAMAELGYRPQPRAADARNTEFRR